MRKLSLAFLIVGITLCHAACAMTDSGMFSGGRTQYGWQLKEWVGKSPQAIMPGNPFNETTYHPALWEDSEIKANMIELLGETEYRDFTNGWGAGGPNVTLVFVVDDQIAFEASGEHSDPKVGGVFYISTKDKTVQACWRTGGARWFAPKRTSRTLSKESCIIDRDADFLRIYREQNALDKK